MNLISRALLSAITLVRVDIPIPGHEPARDALLARDMAGDLDMGSHDLADVNAIDVVEMRASRSIAGAEVTGIQVNASRSMRIDGNELDGTAGTVDRQCRRELQRDGGRRLCCAGDLICGIYSSSRGCRCYCANQCGA